MLKITKGTIVEIDTYEEVDDVCIKGPAAAENDKTGTNKGG